MDEGEIDIPLIEREVNGINKVNFFGTCSLMNSSKYFPSLQRSIYHQSTPRRRVKF